VRFSRTELGEPDESGRRRPVPTGEEFSVEADTVVIAIGYGIEQDLPEASDIAVEDWRVIIDPETGETSRPGVFAGGDCVNGADLVVTAMAGGRKAAVAIDTYLKDQATRAA